MHSGYSFERPFISEKKTFNLAISIMQLNPAIARFLAVRIKPMPTVSKMALVMALNEFAFFGYVQLIVVAALLIFRFRLPRPKRNEVINKCSIIS